MFLKFFQTLWTERKKLNQVSRLNVKKDQSDFWNDNSSRRSCWRFFFFFFAINSDTYKFKTEVSKRKNWVSSHRKRHNDRKNWRDKKKLTITWLKSKRDKKYAQFAVRFDGFLVSVSKFELSLKAKREYLLFELPSMNVCSFFVQNHCAARATTKKSWRWLLVLRLNVYVCMFMIIEQTKVEHESLKRIRLHNKSIE